MEEITIIDTDYTNITNYGICGYKDLKREGYPEKICWMEKIKTHGLVIKTVVAEKSGNQGMIEWINSEYAMRPVIAENYLFINCLFVGFRKEFKGNGYASQLIDLCIQDAMDKNKSGVCVVTRKGSFMPGKDIFTKKGFKITDTAKPDFELLTLSFTPDAKIPLFNESVRTVDKKYSKGIFIFRSDQCPYSVKNVKEIQETAVKDFNTEVTVIDLNIPSEAQQSPSPFGTFCVVVDGVVKAHNPISKTRFVNIMNEVKKK